MNVTINNTMLTTPTAYSPDRECFEWALNQHVTIYNNMELTLTLFVAAALTMLIIYEYLNDNERLRRHAPAFVSHAKYLIYIFFFMYFVVIKMRLVHYITGG